MKFYTNVVQFGNNILFRGIDNGERVQHKVPFSPTLFVRSKKDTPYKSMFGEALEPIQLGDINEAYDFIKRYKDVDGFPIFGNTNFAYQFISDNYKGEIDFDLSQIRIVTIDIETTADEGFPDAKNPNEEILLISIQDYATKEIITYGCRPFKADGTHYVLCSSENELLTRFVSDFSKIRPDVITGWNCEFFDIAYLISRINKKFGESFAKKLSPWNVIKDKEVNRAGRTDITYDIFGIETLDYLDLYKKFTYNAQESYKLDHIAKVELGAAKLSYDEYDSFKDFYTKDWQKFVEYNIQDVRLVDRLEEKMKLIELIITMAYSAKSNYGDIFSAVRTWDCLLYNHFLSKNIVVQQPVYTDTDTTIEGGYVKEPVPGKYDWVVSFDATSLYPSIIMQYNMSPETLIGVDSFNVTMKKLLEGSVDLLTAKENNYAVAANGHCFKRDSQGLFPEIVEKIFADRQKYKKLMIAAQKEYEQTKESKLQNDISRYNNRQMASKILLNSLFGACANKYFRFFDNRIAEGITLTGQFIIQRVAAEMNVYLNKVCATEGVEYAFYADTDSCYITLEKLVEKFFKNKTKEQTIDIINKTCEEQLVKVINKACKHLADYTNAFDPSKVYFKREAIADRGIWVAKKRYALNVYDNEGVRYKEPKLKVMGLEIVRSSTPEAVRKALKEAVTIALTKDENSLQSYVEEVEKMFRKLPVEEMSFPRSVNGMFKYSSKTTIYVKGTPIHVRGALLYNDLLRKHNLSKKYETIKEGDKIKFVYLREPNQIREDCIAYTSALPKEFNLHSLVNYDLMFEKTFLDPISTILNCIGWKAKPAATLEGLFS